jgi:hypothetical protein
MVPGPFLQTGFAGPFRIEQLNSLKVIRTISHFISFPS